jgi:predicted permease
MPGLARAIRSLSKARGFTLATIVMLALGIGASTAIFSLVYSVLLRDLPYANPSKLVAFRGEWRKRGLVDFPFSNADFFDLRDGAKSTFAGLAAFDTGRTSLPMADGRLEPVTWGIATPNLFRLLGAHIIAGRDFEEADGEPLSSDAGAAANPRANAAIISEEYWKRRYAANPAIIGHGLVNGTSGPTIVGILGAGFELLLPPNLIGVEPKPDYWVAARLRYDAANRNNVSLHIIGRLAPNASLSVAAKEVEAVAIRIDRTDEIRKGGDFHIHLEPMRRYLVARVRPAVLALMGAAAFLFLIACSNVASLMLVRTARHERELAVRAALGAGRWALAGQVLSEAVVIAGVGALVGFALALLATRALTALAPPGFPRLDGVGLSVPFCGFCFLAGLAAVFVSSLPALFGGFRSDLMLVLRRASRSVTGDGLLSRTVTVAEIALSCVLLVGSGLMIRSFLALERIDPGFDPRHVLTFELLSRRASKPEQRAEFLREVQQSLRTIPGVLEASAASGMPLLDTPIATRWGPEEALTDPSKFRQADVRAVLPNYFETMGVRLLEGRTFNEDDNAPNREVVVVDDLLAATAFPGRSAVGRHILMKWAKPEIERVEIIGVVQHQRLTALADVGREQFYVTDGYWYGAVSQFAVRTHGEPAELGGAIRKQMAMLSPEISVTGMRTMDSVVADAQAGTRFSLILLGVFGGIAWVLSGIGLFGIVSAAVHERTSELGIRIALGAMPTTLFTSVVQQGLVLCALGLAVGVPASIGLTRFMSSLLVGIQPSDPAALVSAGVAFLLIAAIASSLPAYRAVNIDPATTLRGE